MGLAQIHPRKTQACLSHASNKLTILKFKSFNKIKTMLMVTQSI
jgi:hypothetical protein